VKASNYVLLGTSDVKALGTVFIITLNAISVRNITELAEQNLPLGQKTLKVVNKLSL